MSADVDWAATSGCARCDEHGPFWPGNEELARDLHQAWHAIVAALMSALRIPHLVRWLSERL